MRSIVGVKWFCLGLALVFMLPTAWRSQADAAADDRTSVTRFVYRARGADSPEIEQALALYGAKQAAVMQAAEQLSQMGLLPDFGAQQTAIYCLVAHEMNFVTLEDETIDAGHARKVSIRSQLSLADFVRAEVLNIRLDREERQFDLKTEMEPTVGTTIQPALELSRAYRYLGHEDWRKTIIYIDLLQQKYPNWGALYTAKGMAFRGMHETALAEQAFDDARRLGEPAAGAKPSIE